MADLSGFGSYRPLTVPPKPKPKPSHNWYDGITGFIGHLGSDAVHVVTGLPMGVVQMIQHPIASAEASVKATWQDWSPLFHGDVRTWEHNFFEHPLGPILDVASVLTLGAGTAARAGAIISHSADLAAATSAADVVANTSRAALATGSLARFSNPARAGLMQHILDVSKEHPGMHMEDVIKHANERNAASNLGTRIVKTKGGVRTYQSLSRNPLIRSRQKLVIKAGNVAADSRFAGSKLGEKIGVKGLVGDQAFARRWLSMDKSRRAHATAYLLNQQIAIMAKGGEISKNLGPHELANVIHPNMMEGMVKQAHQITPEGRLVKGQMTRKQANALTQLEKGDQLRFILAKEHHAAALEKVQETIKKSLEAGDNETKAFAKGMQSWGGHFTTTDVRKAFRDDKGDYLMSSSRAAKRVGNEAANTNRVIQLLYTNPTKAWKWMVLAASPRYFVNNVVGNTIMLGMSMDPLSMSRAMYWHIANVHGVKKADSAMVASIRAAHGPNTKAADVAVSKFQAGRLAEGKTHNLRTHAGEHMGLGREDQVSTAEDTMDMTVRKTKRFFKTGLYGITHRMSDTFHRDIAMNYARARTPEFQAAYSMLSHKGVTGYARQIRASEIADASPRVRSFVRENVSDTLGQYHHFTKLENHIRGIVPFYSWDRAITRHTAKMVTQRPYQAAMLSAIGQRGTAANKDILGNLPDFLQNVIPAKALEAMGGPVPFLTHLATGGSMPGRTPVLLTQGVNPYSTLGDLINSGMAAAGGKARMGDTLGAQINPVVQGGIETLSGTSLTTGQPVSAPAGILGAYLGPAENLPETKIVELLIRKMSGQGYQHAAPGKSPFLYSKDLRPQVAGFLGVPERQMSRAAAERMFAAQEGTPTPTKHKKTLRTYSGSGSLGSLPGL